MKNILIVDDLKPFIETQKNILSRSDVCILTATSGIEALAIHKDTPVDLMVIDLDMPGMAGDELCESIRKDTTMKHVSILMATRHRESDIERCKKCGANDYITKPIKSEVLIQKAGALLGISERKSYRVFVRVNIDGSKGSLPFSALTINISSGGMLIEAKQMLQPGDIVNCSFFLPVKTAISVKGAVIRVIKKQTTGSFQYGIQFKEISESVRQLIDSFVKGSSASKD